MRRTELKGEEEEEEEEEEGEEGGGGGGEEEEEEKKKKKVGNIRQILWHLTKLKPTCPEKKKWICFHVPVVVGVLVCLLDCFFFVCLFVGFCFVCLFVCFFFIEIVHGKRK